MANGRSVPVRHLFDPGVAEEVKQRIGRVQAESPRQWGNMEPAETLAHCTRGLHMAMGVIHAKRAPFPASLLGVLIRPLVFGSNKPLRRNSPSSPSLFPNEGTRCDLERERAELIATVDSFTTQGAACCSRNAHPFFGRLKPQQWAILMYKHLDHHLRQFNA